MAAMVLYGAGSGALHAVTGPDHVLSLGPVALVRRRGSWRIGLAWGAGHAVGTVALALSLLLAAHHAHVETVAAWGDRFAGIALMTSASWSAWCARRHVVAGAADERNPLWVGLIHGVSGAGSLLLLMPALSGGSNVHGGVFLAAFAAGSTIAMAGLTHAIAKVGASLSGTVIRRFQGIVTGASIGLGAWLVLSA